LDLIYLRFQGSVVQGVGDRDDGCEASAVIGLNFSFELWWKEQQHKDLRIPVMMERVTSPTLSESEKAGMRLAARQLGRQGNGICNFHLAQFLHILIALSFPPLPTFCPSGLQSTA
jgi:hypothetical protein